MRYAAFLLILVILGACKNQEPAPRAYNFSAAERMIVDSLWNYNKNIYVAVTKGSQTIFKVSFFNSGDDRYSLFSATKWLSAATVMTLVDERKVSLDDTVGKFLPRFTQFGKGKITIRQLLSHTSGLSGFSRFETNASLTLAQAVDSIARVVPLRYTPGTTFNYGDVSMQVAGRVAEVVSGKSWNVLFREKITTPCQMSNTYFVRTQNPNIATGAVSTPNDYLRFLQVLLNRGRYDQVQVLSEATLQLMEQSASDNTTIVYTPYAFNPFTPIGRLEPLRYGQGLWRDVLDIRGNATEFSSPGVNGVHPWIDRKNNLAGVIFTDATFAKTWTTSLKIREIVRKEVE
ncbi:MAG: serine hydrolase domain-containing protein [Runella sp.]